MQEIRGFLGPDSRIRTVGGVDLVVLNESIVYERLNNILDRLEQMTSSKFSLDLQELVPISFIFGPNFSSSLSLTRKQRGQHFAALEG